MANVAEALELCRALASQAPPLGVEALDLIRTEALAIAKATGASVVVTNDGARTLVQWSGRGAGGAAAALRSSLRAKSTELGHLVVENLERGLT